MGLFRQVQRLGADVEKFSHPRLMAWFSGVERGALWGLSVGVGR